MKPRHHSTESTEDIRAGIEQTRAQMDGTIDELTERLRPRHILDDLLEYFQGRRERGAHDGERVKQAANHAKDTAADAGRAIIRQVKQHPIPSMLIGAGIAWFLMESDNEEGSSGKGYAKLYSDDAAEMYHEEQGGEFSGMPLLEGTEEVDGPASYALPSHYSKEEHTGGGTMQNLQNKGEHLKAKASETIRRARRKTAEKSEMLRQKASEMGTQWKEQAHDAYEHGVDAFKRTSDDHPLAVGVGFLALGVLAGMLIPSTSKENQLVGPTRDRLVRRTREAAEEAVERGKNVAGSVIEAAKHEAREQGLTPEGIKEKGVRVAEAVKSAAREEGLSAETLKSKAQAVSQQAAETAQRESKQQFDKFKTEV